MTPPTTTPTTYENAVELATVPDWASFAGWWRRHDATTKTWLFATSNLRTADWVGQDEMVRQLRTYGDAVELSGEPGEQWRPYARWWRRYDQTSKTYRFARSNRRDAEWLDMAGMVAAESRPATQATPRPTTTTQPEAGLLPVTPNPVAAAQRVADDLVARLRQIDGIAELSADELLTIIDEEFTS